MNREVVCLTAMGQFASLFPVAVRGCLLEPPVLRDHSFFNLQVGRLLLELAITTMEMVDQHPVSSVQRLENVKLHFPDSCAVGVLM